MSILSKKLSDLGVPKVALDGLQVVIDGLTGQVHDQVAQIVAGLRERYASLLPTPEALVDSVKRQPQFKAIYRELPPAQQAGVDRALLAAMMGALVKVRKALGL